MRLATSALRAAQMVAPRLSLLTLLLGISAVPMAQTTLAPGDLVVTGLVADGNESFALLATVDIETGTVFTITDKGVNAAGEIQPNRESYREFTTTAPISAGDAFIASEDATPFYPDALGTPTRGTSFISFSTSGDQVLIFQGEETNPTFIFLYSSNPFDQNWVNTLDDGTDPGNDPVDQSGTALPPGLVNGVSAIDFDPHVDNAEYDRANGTMGTRAEILTLVANDANYTTSDDRFDLMGGSFTVTSGTGDASMVVINEVDADQTDTDNGEFVELYNMGTETADLTGHVLVFFNGSDDASYEPAFDLDGVSIAAGGYYVICGDAANVPNCDMEVGAGTTNLIQNGADAVALLVGNAVDFPNDTPAASTTPATLIDAVVYGTSDPDATGLLAAFGETVQYDENANGNKDTESIQRSPDGDERFIVTMPTPGTANVVQTGPEMFTALALGANEVPAVETGARGGVTATLEGTTMTVTGAFAYLESAFAAAHLHGGASGENGPVRFALTATTAADGFSGAFEAASNTFEVRSTFADSLRAGLIYVNIHTSGNGGGEIRGQLGTGADVLPVALSGDQEVPPVDTPATGAATVTVDGTMVSVQGMFDGLTGDYAASHVHAAARGANGPVVFALSAIVPVGGSPTSGMWEAEGNTFEVSTTFADSLRAGLAYINVHSSASPSGEIRGQIGFESDMMIEPMTIAEVRASGVGQEVVFIGIVTRAQGRSSFVQDETAGISLFQSAGPLRDAIDAGNVAAGDSLMVMGTTSEFNGLFQISPVNGFKVLSRGNELPLLQRVTLAEIASNGEEYESELIEVRDLTIADDGDGLFDSGSGGGQTYAISDATSTDNAVSLRVPGTEQTLIGGQPIPAAGDAVFRGVLGQFDSSDPRDSGYQLSPVGMNDVGAQGDASALVINEILYDPASELAGDANGDGTRDGVQDEFVEIVNAGTGSVDLSGFVIEDLASLDADDVTFVRHRFPVGTILEAGQGIVVFGGGTPTGNFGSALVQISSNNGLGLNNGGDTVTLADGAITANAGGNVIATVVYDGAVQDEAIARIPDLTGEFVAHSSNPQNPVLFSPGVSNLTGGGGGFPSASEETPDGTLVLNVANPLRSDAQVRFETPASGDVSLVLYDALGRQVAVLAEGDLASGAHTATLRTQALAPGVYILRLAASGVQLTRTLTVVR